MKRAKGGMEKINCFPLKEAVSGRLREGGAGIEIYSYICMYIYTHTHICVYIYKIL